MSADPAVGPSAPALAWTDVRITYQTSRGETPSWWRSTASA